MIKALLTSVREETRAVLADKAVLLILLGGTLFYALFYPLPYLDQVARNVPVIVVDNDHSAASRQLIRYLDATEQLDIYTVISDQRLAEEGVRQGEWGGIIDIPANFERDMLRQETVSVGIMGNAAYALLYSQIATAASSVAATYSAGVGIARLEASGVPPAQALQRVQAIDIQLRELFNPAGAYGTYVVPAVLVLILQQTLLISVGMMGAGRWRNAPWSASWGELAWYWIGRHLPYVLIHLLMSLIIMVLVFWLYRFPSQAALLFSLWLLLPFLFATVSFGFLLAMCFQSRETVLEVLVLMSLPTLFLAGFAWPSEAMPSVLVMLGWGLPSTAGIDVFVRAHQMGASFDEVSSSWWWLWGLGTFYWLMSFNLLNRR